MLDIDNVKIGTIIRHTGTKSSSHKGVQRYKITQIIRPLSSEYRDRLDCQAQILNEGNYNGPPGSIRDFQFLITAFSIDKITDVSQMVF